MCFCVALRRLESALPPMRVVSLRDSKQLGTSRAVNSLPVHFDGSMLLTCCAGDNKDGNV